MTKDEIKDISYGIEMGENRGPQFGTLTESIKAGEIVKIDADMLITLSDSGEVAAGVLDKHYNVDLDTDMVSGDQGHIINRGYVAAFCEDPGEDKEIGSSVYNPVGTAGSLSWSADGVKFGTTVARIENGDKVALIYIDRG